MTAQDYIAEREITPGEVASWHLDVCEDHLGFPLLNVAGVYCCTIKRMFTGPSKYEYPKDYPIHIHLYGINVALPAIREWGFAVVVEGPLDCIAMHRVGAKNTVAYLGNHVTKWQALSLARWTDRLLVIPDADSGGTKGLEKTKENVNGLLHMGVYRLAPGLDPDQMARCKNSVALNEFQGTMKRIMERLHD